MPSDYRPVPRDTSGVRLPAQIGDLTELLAKNAHENWARQRMEEGWRWGPRRDDEHKLHPSLVPYEQLSESEGVRPEDGHGDDRQAAFGRAVGRARSSFGSSGISIWRSSSSRPTPTSGCV
jgi:hypothetical protein